ncbi:hypothetical protein PsAD46_02634 [Pseudovibrio sp. Ad46]|nr:hypothetical protein PsAD46_02634 [Pseudovibrio sp. Ad46]
MLIRPAFSAAVAISSASAKLLASGFSQKTCLPPARSGIVVGWWTASGVTFATASNSPHARASSSEVKRLAMLCSSQKAVRRSSLRSTPPTISTPSISPNLLAWLFAMPPVPTITRRINDTLPRLLRAGVVRVLQFSLVLHLLAHLEPHSDQQCAVAGCRPTSRRWR